MGAWDDGTISSRVQSIRSFNCIKLRAGCASLGVEDMRALHSIKTKCGVQDYLPLGSPEVCMQPLGIGIGERHAGRVDKFDDAYASTLRFGRDIQERPQRMKQFAARIFSRSRILHRMLEVRVDCLGGQSRVSS